MGAYTEWISCNIMEWISRISVAFSAHLDPVSWSSGGVTNRLLMSDIECCIIYLQREFHGSPLSEHILAAQMQIPLVQLKGRLSGA